MSSLPYVYLNRLKSWLQQRLVDDPLPSYIDPNGLILVGRYQDSPTNYPWIVSLHQNDPEEVGGSDLNWRHSLDGSQEVVGGHCAASYWVYRYTVSVTMNMTTTGESQEEAFDKGTLLVQWLRRQIDAGTVANLGSLTTTTGETALGQRVTRITQRELGGPPASYIAVGKLYIEQQVFVSSP
jgi:hypothetical protein